MTQDVQGGPEDKPGATQVTPRQTQPTAQRRPWWHWVLLLVFLLLIAVIQFIPD